MEKILIMTDAFLPKALANGICVHQISLKLIDMGYEVHIIAYKKKSESKSETIDQINIHRVRQRLFFRLRLYGEENANSFLGRISYNLAMVINKIKKLIYIKNYPMTSIVFTLRYYFKAKKLHTKYHFDLTISVYNPIESYIAGVLLKRKFTSMILVLYVLDSLTNNGLTRFTSKKLNDGKGWKWEKKGYSVADLILNMKCHEEHHNKQRYNQYREKMRIVDIPLFRSISCNQNCNVFDSSIINLVYTGALGFEYRNPKYLCDLFLSIPNIEVYKLHFYSRGNSESMLEKYQMNSLGKIVRHGYVDVKTSISAICSASILISIGNTNSTMIPSKIFEYMSTGKPIIHLYSRSDDSCLPYYSQYKNVMLIDQSDQFEINRKKLDVFLRELKSIDFDEIKSVFYKNTPEYTAKLIDDELSMKNKKNYEE